MLDVSREYSVYVGDREVDVIGIINQKGTRSRTHTGKQRVEGNGVGTERQRHTRIRSITHLIGARREKA